MIPMNSYANNRMVVHVFEINGEYVLNIRYGKKKQDNKRFGKDLGAAQNEFYAIVEKQNKLIEELIKQY